MVVARSLRPLVALGALLALIVGLLSPTQVVAKGGGEDGDRHWVGSWSFSPQMPGGLDLPFASGFEDQTVREIAHVSIGGSAIRLRLSNAFGSHPVTVGKVGVGIEQEGAALVPGSSRLVTFRGRGSVTIRAGSEVLSDPLAIKVQPEENLAVSLFLRGSTGTPTTHNFTGQVNYASGTGDFVTSEQADRFTDTGLTSYFLDGVDVVAAERIRGAVVALGDSLTDGAQSTVNANTRWPDDLARRFLAGPPGRVMSVLNQGIGGNRVLNDSPCFGVSALHRLDRDVLSQTGVRDVILVEGGNDIVFDQITPSTPLPIPFQCFQPNTNVSADQIIRGYRQIIARVHAEALRIFGGTLTPFKGSFFWSPAAETKREALNDWIRTGGAFDGVIDFARATADASEPLALAPGFDSGDHMHPNDAGYQAMADAIPLRLFADAAES